MLQSRDWNPGCHRWRGDPTPWLRVQGKSRNHDPIWLLGLGSQARLLVPAGREGTGLLSLRGGSWAVAVSFSPAEPWSGERWAAGRRAGQRDQAGIGGGVTLKIEDGGGSRGWTPGTLGATWRSWP